MAIFIGLYALLEFWIFTFTVNNLYGFLEPDRLMTALEGGNSTPADHVLRALVCLAIRSPWSTASKNHLSAASNPSKGNMPSSLT